MSYFNWVNLQYSNPFDEKIDVSVIQTKLEEYLSRRGIHSDVAKDLHRLFATGSAEIRLHTEMIENLLSWVAQERPSVDFGIQGRGEELRDVWVREYAGGENTFSKGPFLFD